MYNIVCHCEQSEATQNISFGSGLPRQPFGFLAMTVEEI